MGFMTMEDGDELVAEVELLHAMIAQLQRRIGVLEATNAEFSRRSIVDRRKRTEAETELRKLKLHSPGGEV